MNSSCRNFLHGLATLQEIIPWNYCFVFDSSEYISRNQSVYAKQTLRLNHFAIADGRTDVTNVLQLQRNISTLRNEYIIFSVSWRCQIELCEMRQIVLYCYFRGVSWSWLEILFGLICLWIPVQKLKNTWACSKTKPRNQEYLHGKETRWSKNIITKSNRKQTFKRAWHQCVCHIPCFCLSENCPNLSMLPKLP